MFVNLGLGTNGSSNFNISLTPSPLNVTGKGSLCLKDLDIPADLKAENGLNATIQVVTVGESGSALYNCADITFSTNTSAPDSENCPNTDAIKVEELTTATSTSSTTNMTSSPSASSSSSGEKSASTSLSAVVILLGSLGVASLLTI
ncbi:hypothetical protein EYC80_009570 [Monilinia laxa]|uniref:Copper acquisition factor BIM1-like domain-containing protein n=1 Tax=Monilinia laxa TaxID=61186 RepID=A0A5N6JY84_MONLA|nr:hypothetical protein EYC80_009570 [Monilinia laxa]